MEKICSPAKRIGIIMQKLTPPQYKFLAEVINNDGIFIRTNTELQKYNYISVNNKRFEIMTYASLLHKDYIRDVCCATLVTTPDNKWFIGVITNKGREAVAGNNN